MMLKTLSTAAVNKGDDGCLKKVGSCGENITGSSIANLRGRGEVREKRVEYNDNEVGGRGLESAGSGESYTGEHGIVNHS